MKPTILIVDDETDIRLNLAELMVLEGFKVATARNGEDAISYMLSDREKPSLIMLDLKMPVKNGHEVIKEFKTRADIPQIPIVVISSEERTKEELGVHQYFTKPYEPQHVIEAVKNLI